MPVLIREKYLNGERVIKPKIEQELFRNPGLKIKTKRRPNKLLFFIEVYKIQNFATQKYQSPNWTC